MVDFASLCSIQRHYIHFIEAYARLKGSYKEATMFICMNMFDSPCPNIQERKDALYNTKV